MIATMYGRVVSGKFNDRLVGLFDSSHKFLSFKPKFDFLKFYETYMSGDELKPLSKSFIQVSMSDIAKCDELGGNTLMITWKSGETTTITSETKQNYNSLLSVISVALRD